MAEAVDFDSDGSCSDAESSEVESSDSDESDVELVEELVNFVDEGEVVVERVLVRAEATTWKDHESSGHSHYNFPGGGYVSLFFSTLDKIEKEDNMILSIHGTHVLTIVKSLKSRHQCASTVGMVVKMFKSLESCIERGDRYRLPSAKQKNIWMAFHVARFEVVKEWDCYIQTALALPDHLKPYTNMTFQIIFDRLLKALIAIGRKEVVASGSQPNPDPIPLDDREKNVVRYMGGYVAVKLLRRYSKKTSNERLKKKWKMFVTVLKGMKADNQPLFSNAMSCDDYTRVWSEILDRGGLYHINHQVSLLIERMEIIVRRHLHVDFSSSESKQSDIDKDMMKDEQVLQIWDDVASSIADKYEEYSIELLKAVCHLWTTIRCYSFTKGYNIFSKSGYQRGTRKRLKNKGTEKDAL